MSKYIALDVGTKRVGIATCDDLGISVSPFGTVTREESVDYISEMVAKEQPEAIIVGMPYLPSGGLGSQAGDVKAFVADLQKEIATVIDFENEVLTSNEAENRLHAMGKRRLDKAEIDAMAACIILESYLSRQVNDNKQQSETGENFE